MNVANKFSNRLRAPVRGPIVFQLRGSFPMQGLSVLSNSSMIVQMKKWTPNPNSANKCLNSYGRCSNKPKKVCDWPISRHHEITMPITLYILF